MRDCVDRRVTPPERVTSPTWGSPPPCKQARDSWPNYHLNHLPQRGRDFDTTIKFNASTGEQYCDDWIINCMWLQVALDAKLVCVCFAPFLSFLPRPASQGGQFAPNRRIFACHLTSTECTEKGDLIDIFAPQLIRESANGAAKQIMTHESLIFLKRSGSRP